MSRNEILTKEVSAEIANIFFSLLSHKITFAMAAIENS